MMRTTTGSILDQNGFSEIRTKNKLPVFSSSCHFMTRFVYSANKENLKSKRKFEEILLRSRWPSSL